MIPGSANPLLLATAAGAGGYEIERSLRFNSSDSAYLSRTPSTAGNRKTWTFAAWVKLSSLNPGWGAAQQGTIFSSGAAIAGGPTMTYNGGLRFAFGGDPPGTDYYRETVALFRDPSAWYHCVWVQDTTQSTGNRWKIYVNGVLQALQNAGLGEIGLDASGGINSTSEHRIGTYVTTGVFYDGYLADIHFLDGLTPGTDTDDANGSVTGIPNAEYLTDFGEFDDNGIWQPIEYSGTYGTNGFHLPFSDNSTAAALGTDSSGQGNTWSVNNISVTAGAGNDSLVDVPTNGSEVDTGSGGQVRGNYCTWNPLDNGSITLANGNLDTSTTTASNKLVRGTIGVSTGKWYWEVFVTAKNNDVLGVANRTLALTGVSLANPGDANSSGIYTASFSNGSILGFALDLDSGKLFIAENNTWKNSGNPVTGANPWSSSLTSGPYFPAHTLYNFDGVPQYSWNFGQRPFAYTAPSGFKALNTANLPAPLVTKPSEYMDVLTITGANQAYTGLNFSPDFLWFKRRDNIEFHYLFDAVRGGASILRSNLTDAEGTGTTYISSFDTNGFTTTNNILSAGASYVAWTWDAGSSTVTNTQGSISSQVRANASAGFSIVTYTSSSSVSTVGHGLNVAPYLIITKNRSVSNTWWTYHNAIGNTKAMRLDTTSAETTISSTWNNTSPTSSVFTVGGEWGNGNNIVAYCFAPVAGYSAFGSYTGNGLSSGVFVYTGFAPRWIFVKRTDSSAEGGWCSIDSARETYNYKNKKIVLNDSASETTFQSVNEVFDFLSNGFIVRSNGFGNVNGSTNIYAAFAESPLALNNRAR